MKIQSIQSAPMKSQVLTTAVCLAALLVSASLFGDDRNHGGGQAPRAPAPAQRAPAPAPRAPAVFVDRSSHGSVRHVETQVIHPPVFHEPPHQEPPHREPGRPEGIRPEDHRYDDHHGFAVGIFHGFRDVEVDIHHPQFWHDFSYGRRHDVLPGGYLALRLGALSYFYCNGIYYQPIDGGGYQEVYPPVGADVPQPPDGSIEVDAGGQAYYYAGGAFYLQQPDGTFAIAPTPIGVVVPELPPGAVQVVANGSVAYQYNGIYYEPVFVNGVTQYETFLPQ